MTLNHIIKMSNLCRYISKLIHRFLLPKEETIPFNKCNNNPWHSLFFFFLFSFFVLFLSYLTLTLICLIR